MNSDFKNSNESLNQISKSFKINLNNFKLTGLINQANKFPLNDLKQMNSKNVSFFYNLNFKLIKN